MTKRTLVAIAGSGLLLLAAGAGRIGAAPPGANDTRPPRSVKVSLTGADGEGAPEGVLGRAAYEIEIFGATAVGRLAQEFRNEAEEDRTYVLGIAFPEGVEVESFALEADGDLRELDLEVLRSPSRPEPRSAKRRRPSAAAREKARAATAGFMSRDELAEELKKLRPETETGQPESDPTAAGPGPAVLRSAEFEIQAGGAVIVHTVFRLPLSVESGVFRLVLPSIEPRGMRHDSMEGSAAPPLAIGVAVLHDEPLADVRSSSHRLLHDFVRDRTIIEPVQSEVPADRPFHLEFEIVAEHEPTLAGYVRSAEGDLHAVEALFQPPREPREGTERAKQVLFILDTSGSMKPYDKLDQARSAVSGCIAQLGPDDRFNIVEFDNDFSRYNPKPMAIASTNVEAVDAWLGSLRAEGGTKLLPALAATLEQPADPERHRMIILVTDGILQDEQPVLELLEEKLGDGRLFVVAAGAQHRQETILRLAEYGRGAAVLAGNARALAEAVTELFDGVSRPLGWDLEFDWEGAEVERISPSRLPDLYAGRPVRVLAWVRGEMPESLRLRMSTTGGERRFQVQLPPAPNR